MLYNNKLIIKNSTMYINLKSLCGTHESNKYCLSTTLQFKKKTPNSIRIEEQMTNIIIPT